MHLGGLLPYVPRVRHRDFGGFAIVEVAIPEISLLAQASNVTEHHAPFGREAIYFQTPS